MRNFSKTALLCAVLCLPAAPGAHAFGSKAPSSGSSNQTNALIDLGLNLAITYAKMDPRYSTVLAALGINSAQDVRSFLQGNSNGTNFQNILARLGMLAANQNPKVQSLLTQMGIKNEADLRNFLKSGQGGINYQNILAIALAQAQSNPKYASWLQKLNITSVADIQKLVQGGGSGNLQSMIISIGLNYLQSNPKYAAYVPAVQLAASLLGINIPSTSTGLDLGAFTGMNVGEVMAIQGVK